jgi:hypothetical protein
MPAKDKRPKSPVEASQTRKTGRKVLEKRFWDGPGPVLSRFLDSKPKLSYPPLIWMSSSGIIRL